MSSRASGTAGGAADRRTRPSAGGQRAAAFGPSRLFFDAWSRTYDNPLVQALTYRPVHTAVLHELSTHRPRLVLDGGCGTGLFATRVRAEFDAVGRDRFGGTPWHKTVPARLERVEAT